MKKSSTSLGSVRKFAYSEYGDEVAFHNKREDILLSTKLRFLERQERIGLYVLKKQKNEIQCLQDSIKDQGSLSEDLDMYDKRKEQDKIFQYGVGKDVNKSHNAKQQTGRGFSSSHPLPAVFGSNKIMTKRTNVADLNPVNPSLVSRQKPRALSLRQLKRRRSLPEKELVIRVPQPSTECGGHVDNYHQQQRQRDNRRTERRHRSSYSN